MGILGRLESFGAGCLRVSLAIIFLWFGALKLAGLCPLAGFISRSVPFLPSQEFLFLLGCWEVAIGACLLVRPLVVIGLWLLLFHLPGTVLPMFVIPHECFTQFPYGLTLEGQYVIKNLVLASAAVMLAGRYQMGVSGRHRTGIKPVPVGIGLPAPRSKSPIRAAQGRVLRQLNPVSGR